MENARHYNARSCSRTDSGYSFYRAANAAAAAGRNTTIKAAMTDCKDKMPKNFSQPLTCFYWHTYGHCNKSDESCLFVCIRSICLPSAYLTMCSRYAHYSTGVVAAAPVSLGGSKGNMEHLLHIMETYFDRSLLRTSIRLSFYEIWETRTDDGFKRTHRRPECNVPA